MTAKTTDNTEPVMREDRYTDGAVQRRVFYLDGLPHRDPADGPAIEEFHPNGVTSAYCYYVHGIRHRNPDDGPAFEDFDESGVLHNRRYYVNNVYHRCAGPATELFRADGTILRREWWNRGTLWKSSNPAFDIDLIAPSDDKRYRAILTGTQTGVRYFRSNDGEYLEYGPDGTSLESIEDGRLYDVLECAWRDFHASVISDQVQAVLFRRTPDGPLLADRWLPSHADVDSETGPPIYVYKDGTSSAGRQAAAMVAISEDGEHVFSVADGWSQAAIQRDANGGPSL